MLMNKNYVESFMLIKCTMLKNIKNIYETYERESPQGQKNMKLYTIYKLDVKHIYLHL